MAKNGEVMELSNKLAIIQVLAGLIKNPLLFADNDYKFSIDDFQEPFHRIVYGAIEHLALKGMQKIGYIDIDQFLKQYQVQYDVFTKNRGIEYIQKALETYDEKKFNYYYQTLKKYSLLNTLNANGINTKDIYDPDILDPIKNAEMQKRFDNYSVNDIILMEELKITLAKESFGTSQDMVQSLAGDGIDELIEKYKEVPEMGLPLLSPKLTTIYRGFRPGALYLESSSAGQGKAQPNSTIIPTPSGFKRVGDIRQGDYLFDALGKPTKVLAIFPQGKKEVFEVSFKDGRTVQCCKEHLWSYNIGEPHSMTTKERSFVTSTLEEMATQLYKGVTVPLCKPVEYDEKLLSLDPYVLGSSLGLKDRNIPEEYLTASIDQRVALLNGILDTSGHINKHSGTVSYFTVNKVLAEQVREICFSLGMKVTLRQDSKEENNILYHLNLFVPEEMRTKIFKLSSKQQLLNEWEINNKDHHSILNISVSGVKSLQYEEEMTCFLVDNSEHLYLTNDYIVTHNSRRQAGEAVHLATPEYYDLEKKKWVKTKLQEKVLCINTELELAEVQTMWIAHISGVPEDHILDGKYYDNEEERVKKATKILKKAKLYFVSISNYDIDDIENLIKKYYQLYGITCVFYDYLSTTLKIMAEGARKTKIAGLREDQILLMFSTRLKDLAKQLGIAIWSSSQLSGDFKNAKEADQSLLRGSKAIADKCDIGAILLPVREADQAVIDSYVSKGFELRPTHVIHIYKVRRGHYNNIRLYIYFDRSTCRVTDCFVTDNNSKILPVADTNVEILIEDTRETDLEKAFPFEF